MKGYEAVAQAEADEEKLARLNYDLYHRRLLGMMDGSGPSRVPSPTSPAAGTCATSPPVMYSEKMTAFRRS